MLQVTRNRGGTRKERELGKEQSPNSGQNSQQAACQEPLRPSYVQWDCNGWGVGVSERVRRKNLREKRGTEKGDCGSGVLRVAGRIGLIARETSP